MSKISPKAGSLGVIIRSFKSAITRKCHISGHKDFAWQPGFYDHIVRNRKSLTGINRYICTNPEDWERDRYHPGILRAD